MDYGNAFNDMSMRKKSYGAQISAEYYKKEISGEFFIGLYEIIVSHLRSEQDTKIATFLCCEEININ
jgi:hypothetical protein